MSVAHTALARLEALQLSILYFSHDIMLPSPTFAMAAATSGGGTIYFPSADFEHIERGVISLNTFFFRLRFHFGPPMASGAGMRLAVSRRLAVLTLQDRWARGCRRPCDGCIPFFLVRWLLSRNPSIR